MKEMLLRNKGKLVASSLVTLLPILPALWGGGVLWIWEPVILFVSQWFLVLVVFYANRDKNQSPKVLSVVVWILPMLSLVMGLIGQMIQHQMDEGTLICALTSVFLGLMFLAIGNYMPKTKQNGAVGIRIQWTLDSEENWNATHRYAGKVWMVGGLLFLVLALVPNIIVMLLGWTVLLVVLVYLPCRYSYRFYKGQVAQGKAEKKSVNPGVIVVVVVIAAGFLAFLGWSLFMGDIRYVQGKDALLVDAVGWKDLTIPYQEITSLEYFDQDPSQGSSGWRTNGMGNFRMSLGSFHNDYYGDYTRYTFDSCDAVIVLDVDGQTVVLNGPDSTATQELYQALEEEAAAH